MTLDHMIQTVRNKKDTQVFLLAMTSQPIIIFAVIGSLFKEDGWFGSYSITNEVLAALL